MKRNIYSDFSMTGGFGLNVFTDDEIYKIHLATLEVMEKAGLYVGSDEALDILEGGGAIVDRKTRIVKFPAYLVEDAIRSAPSQIILHGRNPKHDIALGAKRVHFSTFGQGVKVVDPFTGELRPSTKKDVGEATLLTDALDEIDVCERSLAAGDVSNDIAPIHEAEEVFANTSKHTIYGPGNGRRARKIIEMAAAIVGGKDKLKEKPIATINCSPTSPLKLDVDCCTGVMECAKAGVPCNLISMVMAGATSPITLAGGLVTHNCEILGAIVLHQLTSKGAPVIYGCSSLSFDLRFTTTPVGSPELGMINAAVPKLAQYYLLPSFVAGG